MPTRSPFALLVRAAGPGFLLLAFLARLPAPMAPLGGLLLVVATTGSYSVAGAAAAALGLGAAAGGPVVGALTDRYGQRRVGLLAALLDTAAYLGLVYSAVAGSVGAVVATAALAGLANPQVGPLVRVRWAALLGDRGEARALPAAMAYEGAADEASFVLGPALVGLLALVGVPAVPMLTAAVATVLAAVPFALHRTVPPVVRAPRGAVRARLPRSVAVLVAAMLGVGMVFGGTQAAVTAFAESTGRGAAAGLVYAVMGVSSALAGVAVAWLPARVGPAARFRVFAVALFVGAVPLLAVGSLGSVVAAMAVVGVAAAPYLITVYALAGRVAPPRRGGAVMTLLASGVVAGVALGAGVAGVLADGYGYRGAFVVPVLAGLFAAVLATLSAGRLAGSAPTAAETREVVVAGTRR